MSIHLQNLGAATEGGGIPFDVTKIVDPTINDIDYTIPYLWVNSDTNTFFMLVAVTNGVALWIKLATDAALPSLVATEIDDISLDGGSF